VDRATIVNDDAAREVHASHAQMLQERRRRARERLSRERVKSLCFALVCFGIIAAFSIVYVLSDWRPAPRPSVVTSRAPDWRPAPRPPVVTVRAPLVGHVESIMAQKRTSRIKVPAQGRVCCLRLRFSHESGTLVSDMVPTSGTVASCDGPVSPAPYEKTTIAGLGTLLGALSRGSEQKGSHALR
jgi:hypothetical protein